MQRIVLYVCFYVYVCVCVLCLCLCFMFVFYVCVLCLCFMFVFAVRMVVVIMGDVNIYWWLDRLVYTYIHTGSCNGNGACECVDCINGNRSQTAPPC